MTDRIHDRVNEVLNEADAESGSMLASDDGESDEAGRDLLEVADEASDLLETAEPRELLEAVGLGTLPDGSEPKTIPEAIANGDPEQVEDLHRLLRLAKLADRSDDGDLEDAVSGLRETIDRARTGEDDDTMTDDTDQDRDETEGESTNGEDVTDDLGDRLRSAMSSSFADFDEEISAMREQLEDATASMTDDEETDDEEAEGGEGEKDGGDGDEDDDGLLGLGGEGGLGSSDSSRHSTMAPPPSERADMRAVKRHSTMPKKNR